MKIKIVIGKGFGDEGKGLAVDYFSREAQRNNEPCLVIRHNGGAQAGHTVDLEDRRFVFHQLSSGSFRGAATYWSATFLPDLFKLREELSAFTALSQPMPLLCAHGDCRCVTVDDVLLNMALETARGDRRHGSCGMGINEAVVRSGAGYGLPLREVKGASCRSLYHRLKETRRDYTAGRLEACGILKSAPAAYAELLRDDNVLYNAAEEMCRAAEYVDLAEGTACNGYGTVIFEGAQGLLLDEDNLAYAPHLTSSKTGLTNPVSFCKSYITPGTAETEAVYVTRSYVTRHGAGRLPYEDSRLFARYGIRDATNLPNEWQGTLRAARHGTAEEFAAPVGADISSAGFDGAVSLMLTHLNETKRCVLMRDGDVPCGKFCTLPPIASLFQHVYASASPLSADTERL